MSIDNQELKEGPENIIVNKDIVNYINSVQGFCHGELGDLQKKALEDDIPIVPQETARFIEMILAIKRPENILEIGCAIGFSAILMSGYLKENGKITTVERNPKMYEKAKINFEKFDVTNKIHLIEGDANEVLKKLEGKFDVVFMDAGKGQYIKILKDCIRLLHKDGILIADDIFQNGNIAKEISKVKRRQRTIYKRMNTFVEIVSNTQGLKSSLIPIGDGILMASRTGEEIKLPPYSDSSLDSED